MSEMFRCNGVPMNFMSVKEFCAEVGICLSTYYKMRKEGMTPKEIPLSHGPKGRVRISRKAALEWVASSGEYASEREEKV